MQPLLGPLVTSGDALLPSALSIVYVTMRRVSRLNDIPLLRQPMSVFGVYTVVRSSSARDIRASLVEGETVGGLAGVQTRSFHWPLVAHYL